MADRDSKGRFIKGMRASPKTEFKKGEHWRPRKPYWSKDWLVTEYTKQLKSALQIAQEQNCTENNILFWLKQHEIPTRSMSEIRAFKKWGLKGEENGMYGVRGEANPNWKGGVTPERQAFYSSIEWQRVARTIKIRDHHQCVRCKSKEEIDIHHVIPFYNPDTRLDPDNLVLLCEKCHYWVHSKQNTGGEFIE